MYYPIVIATMLILPAASLLIDSRTSGSPLDLGLLAKWFTFWAVGVRLFLAGLRQSLQPRYTAHTILGLSSDESLLLVREVGFANLAFGAIGLFSLMRPAWVWPAALAGGIYYGLAGLSHAFHARRNRFENVAMVSDLFASIVLIGVTIATPTQG
jgi:hypothetical protein